MHKEYVTRELLSDITRNRQTFDKKPMTEIKNFLSIFKRVNEAQAGKRIKLKRKLFILSDTVRQASRRNVSVILMWKRSNHNGKNFRYYCRISPFLQGLNISLKELCKTVTSKLSKTTFAPLKSKEFEFTIFRI